MTNASVEGDDRLKIIDAHAHWYDGNANIHRFLDRKDAAYEALVGDYSVLPRSYLADAYLKDSASCRVEGIVWHEYLSEDPVREVQWAQRLAENSPIPLALVGLVDFLDPQLQSRCENVRVGIAAIECIFRMNWRLEQVRPWILALIEDFGPERCMFGSHLPINKLSFGFETLYSAYQQIVADFSPDERDSMFRRVAVEWFRVG